jgi:hypothetical protein
MAYEVENVTRTPLVENLDTKTVEGKLEVLHLGPRAKVTLTDAQWASRCVQKLKQAGRLRSRSV